jgi:hypothetical protein
MMEGKKHDQDKPDWTLLPFRSLLPVIRVMQFGAGKYGRDNWRQVQDIKRRYLAAAFRHLSAYSDGEKVDQESGESHLAHAVCCLLFLLWYE